MRRTFMLLLALLPLFALSACAIPAGGALPEPAQPVPAAEDAAPSNDAPGSMPEDVAAYDTAPGPGETPEEPAPDPAPAPEETADETPADETAPGENEDERTDGPFDKNSLPDVISEPRPSVPLPPKPLLPKSAEETA